MGYLTVKQFSEKWGISERRIIKLCQDERIQGAMKEGRIWSIPEETMKPLDKRSKIFDLMDTQKRVMVVNLNNEIGYELLPLLEKDGYIVEGICKKKREGDIEKLSYIKVYQADFDKREELEQILAKMKRYYDGLIWIDHDKSSDALLDNKEWFIIQMAQKMDCESSVVLVNRMQNAKVKLEAKLAKKSKQRIGFRINSLNLEIGKQNEILINYHEIAEDVFHLFTHFKNTTGMAIATDGGALRINERGRTENLERGIFYRAITQCLQKLDKNSHLWCASMMLEDEWTDEPLEMNFRVNNLEASNRGAKMERIFIFPKSQMEEYRKNKTLQVYMKSNIKTMFVDYDEVLQKEPKLLEIVGNGWDGIDEETLIVDLPSGGSQRGYISQNKEEVQKAYGCFERLKSYARDLKEVLK